MSVPRYLVDTNVLLRAADPASTEHVTATGAISHLFTEGADLCVAGQNLIEFWVVATRPANVNGLGWTPAQTQAEIMRLQTAFTLLPDVPAIFGQWWRLASQYSVWGVQGHDCRLIAVMLVHSATHLLTFNGAHFNRYAPEGITVVNPDSVK